MLGIEKDCPCGSATPYGACCGRLHAGAEQAPTALALMRSRYTAYAVGDAEYVWRTWHPTTRPDRIDLDGPQSPLSWSGLEIHDSGEDWVDFTASYLDADGAGALREHSRFQRRAGRWFYLDGDLS